MEYYMDNSATSIMDESVAAEMQAFLYESYGNPDEDHHFLGEEAKRAVDRTRTTVADRIGNYPENIYFTSGETEGNNWVIKCFQSEKDRVLVSSIEHSSIIKSAETINNTLIKVHENGKIDLAHLEEELKKGDVGLVSIEMANGEIGTIQPVEEIAKLVHEYGALYHCNATYSFGKMRFDADDLDVDFMTLSAHRMHGPKGIGAVYIKKGLSLDPLLHGDSQERGIRAGSLNVPAIVGFGKAVEIAFSFLDMQYDEQKKNTAIILDVFKRYCSEVSINGDLEDRLPCIISIDVPNKNAMESIRETFEIDGIVFSGGLKKRGDTIIESHIIKALGRKPENSFQFSISRFNDFHSINLAAIEICKSIFS